MCRITLVIWPLFSVVFSLVAWPASADVAFTINSRDGVLVHGVRTLHGNHVFLSVKKTETLSTEPVLDSDISSECRRFVSNLAHQGNQPITKTRIADLTPLLIDSRLDPSALTLPAFFFIHEVSDQPISVIFIETMPSHHKTLIRGTIHNKPVTVVLVEHRLGLTLSLYVGHLSLIDISQTQPDILYSDLLVETDPNDAYIRLMIEKTPKLVALLGAVCSTIVDIDNKNSAFGWFLFTALFL